MIKLFGAVDKLDVAAGAGLFVTLFLQSGLGCGLS